MYNYARFQVSRYRKIAGGEHKKKLREWAHTRRLMREDRLAGMKCADIAKKYGYTLHSTRLLPGYLDGKHGFFVSDCRTVRAR
jgi:hypothetical protein